MKIINYRYNTEYGNPMAERLQKLIATYESQIYIYEQTIARLRNEIVDLRRANKDYSLEQEQKKITETQRQRLFQTIKDIETVIGKQCRRNK